MWVPIHRIRLLAILIPGLWLPVALADEQPRATGVVREDRIVAGTEQDFMIVRHLVLKGSNEAIGQALAEIARQRHRVQIPASHDPLRVRTQRRYVEKNAPLLFERMRGVATAFGKRLEDDGWNLSSLDYGQFYAGCSVMHFPPGVTATGTSVISRDYDFSTGTLRGAKPRAGELAATSRPYVVEMYPDRGYASLAMVSYDLLSGVLDGINSEGLTVALLADDELMQKYPMEAAGSDPVGFGSLQMQRLLLDTCATTEEAKECLLQSKQVYEFVPVHYLIADRHGNAFVWEYSHAHNREYIVEYPGKPLVTTNFSLHRHLQDGKPPSAKLAAKVCPRYCTLSERLNSQPGKLTVDFIKETHKLVDDTRPAAAASPRAPGRTLWHALYFPEQRKMQVSFYLKDAANPEPSGKARVARSDYLEFALEGPKSK
jgi:hypothetical protein